MPTEERGELSERSRSRSLISLTFLTAVVGLLVLPLCSVWVHPFAASIKSVDEHRTAHSFPPPSLLLDTSGAFAAGLNKWFDDQVGLRDLLIRTKNQIDYSLFHTSGKVFVGTDGWLFEQATTKARLVMQRLDADRLEQLETSFSALEKRLEAKGIRLVVIGYPDKSMTYPEYLPEQAPKIPRGGNYDKLKEFLAEQPSLIFIDVEELLKQQKVQAEEPLFSRTDIHIGIQGEIPVVKAIVDRIAQDASRPDVRWNENIELRHADWGSGSEARFLSLVWPISERVPYIASGGYAVGDDEPGGRWNVPDPRAVDAVGSGAGLPFDFEFRSTPERCAQLLPGMVIFGNSFSDFYWPLGLHRYFCFMRRSRTPTGRFPGFVDTIPADTKYFILQYLASYLPGEGPSLSSRH